METSEVQPAFYRS